MYRFMAVGAAALGASLSKRSSGVYKYRFMAKSASS